MFAMTVPQATRKRRRCVLRIHQIAKENIRSAIFATSAEHCRPMPMRGSIDFTRMYAFRKLRVGLTFGGSFMICKRRTLRLQRVRLFNESLRCTGSRKRYAADHRMSAEKFATNAPGRCLSLCTNGSRRRF
jgi:hypothetical protein